MSPLMETRTTSGSRLFRPLLPHGELKHHRYKAGSPPASLEQTKPARLNPAPAAQSNNAVTARHSVSRSATMTSGTSCGSSLASGESARARSAPARAPRLRWIAAQAGPPVPPAGSVTTTASSHARRSSTRATRGPIRATRSRSTESIPPTSTRPVAGPGVVHTSRADSASPPGPHPPDAIARTIDDSPKIAAVIWDARIMVKTLRSWFVPTNQLAARRRALTPSAIPAHQTRHCQHRRPAPMRRATLGTSTSQPSSPDRQSAAPSSSCPDSTNNPQSCGATGGLCAQHAA